MAEPTTAAKPLTHEEIEAIAGNMDDQRRLQMVALRPTLEELAEACAWAAQESDVMAKERHPLNGRIALLYDFLTAEDADPEER
jgi:hypothetical protein